MIARFYCLKKVIVGIDDAMPSGDLALISLAPNGYRCSCSQSRPATRFYL